MTNEKNELTQIDEAKERRARLLMIARAKKQSGELSMIEAGAVMAGAALLALAVYAGGKYVGDTSMTQVTVGFQAGGQAYSEIIFFQDKAAFDEFTSGNFEFGAQASAVAITAGASAQTGTTGTTAGASTTKNDATTAANYSNGVAVFTVAKGGLMYEASIGGQKFKYTPKK